MQLIKSKKKKWIDAIIAETPFNQRSLVISGLLHTFIHTDIGNFLFKLWYFLFVLWLENNHDFHKFLNWKIGTRSHQSTWGLMANCLPGRMPILTRKHIKKKDKKGPICTLDNIIGHEAWVFKAIIMHLCFKVTGRVPLIVPDW